MFYNVCAYITNMQMSNTDRAAAIVSALSSMKRDTRLSTVEEIAALSSDELAKIERWLADPEARAMPECLEHRASFGARW